MEHDSSGQAGALKNQEIDVTPEMVCVASEFLADLDFDVREVIGASRDDLAREIIVASLGVLQNP